ncbi:unnamed protein product [Microthlaspi erraticum]|uniref:Uncharacterized protein n=1 Tax=Microthlaspi erraticum TaxID=1685480 RepID=A0A6D2L3Q3_9BRAS|nr:unnamed protein product [Microthlaspi erraticum]
MFRARPKLFRPTEVSAKVQTDRPITQHDPGNIVPRSAKLQVTPRRARPAREPGNKPRGRATRSRTTADASVRAGKERPTSGRETIGQISSADQPADHETSGHDRSDSAQDPTVRPIVPTDRPNAAVDPKPFLKPNPHNSSPKPAPT